MQITKVEHFPATNHVEVTLESAEGSTYKHAFDQTQNRELETLLGERADEFGEVFAKLLSHYIHQTPEQVTAQLEPALRNHMDCLCQNCGYDNVQSAMNWAGFPNPWKAEAEKIAIWAGACWMYHFEALKAVPESVEKYLEGLPVFPEVAIRTV